MLNFLLKQKNSKSENKKCCFDTNTKLIETSFSLTLLLDSLVNVLKTMMLNVYWLDKFRA